MQASGLNLLACLELSAEVSGHALIQEVLPALKDHVQSGGEPWSWFHSHPELYPPVFTQMVRVGSQVARLDTIFGWLANHFEVRAQYRAQEFVKLLEPALLLCMGMALAAVLASLFIPLYGMLGK